MESEDEIFLETAFPSRKITKQYNLKGRIMNRFSDKAFEPLDQEEKELMKSIENEEWHQVDDIKEEKKKAASAARNTLKKDKRINLRLTQKDYYQIQIKAI